MICPHCGEKTFFDYLECPKCGRRTGKDVINPSGAVQDATSATPSSTGSDHSYRSNDLILSTSRTDPTDILRSVAWFELIGSILGGVVCLFLATKAEAFSSLLIIYAFTIIGGGVIFWAVIIVIASMAENLAAIRENTKRIADLVSTTQNKAG